MKFIFSFYAPHMKANTYWQTLQVNKLVIDISEIYELKSSWKLIDLYILQVELKSKLTRTYIVPEWFETGDYSDNIDFLKPSRFGSDFLITLIFNREMPDTIIIEEEIHRTDEIRINTLELTKDEKGLYSFDFPAVDEDGAYVIYRIPYLTGDILFCIMC